MLLRSLAERVHDTTFDQLPPAAVATAKEAILDTLGVTLAGSAGQSDATCIPVAAATTGPALIFGDTRRVDTLSAALINGDAAHALALGCRSNTTGAQLSASILPALWVLAPGISGGAFIAAYAAGLECAAKVAQVLDVGRDAKDWSSAAMPATLGPAAACAHLLRLGPDQIATALALAASMAWGGTDNSGASTQAFLGGQAARNGLRAALLARDGMTADFRHQQNFFASSHVSISDVPRILAEWGRPFELADPGLVFTLHPCCAGAHAALDALLHLRAAHDLTPKYVTRLDVWMRPSALACIDRPDPATGSDGKDSLPYLLARALKHGLVRLEDFSGEAVRDPAIRALMKKIRVAADPQSGLDGARLRASTVRGEVFEHCVDRPLGSGRGHPLPAGALEAKFRNCAETVLDPESAEALVGYCTELDSIPDAGDLLDVIAAGVTFGRTAERDSPQQTIKQRAAG